MLGDPAAPAAAPRNGEPTGDEDADDLGGFLGDMQRVYEIMREFETALNVVIFMPSPSSSLSTPAEACASAALFWSLASSAVSCAMSLRLSRSSSRSAATAAHAPSKSTLGSDDESVDEGEVAAVLALSPAIFGEQADIALCRAASASTSADIEAASLRSLPLIYDERARWNARSQQRKNIMKEKR